MNSNFSNLLDMRNLKEQVKKNCITKNREKLLKFEAEGREFEIFSHSRSEQFW